MTTTGTMKAIRIHSFGGPDQLQLEDLPIPQPKPDQVLVRVHAAGVNPVDWKIREGRRGNIPLPSIMGNDFSGVVESVGSQVSEFRAGDAVFGSAADESGSYAEYAITSTSCITRKPQALDHIRAAALPIAGLTAWQALFDTANLQPGQKILVHAAAGGVGHIAVQLAKWKGAYVIGTASPQNADFLKKLDLDQFIDYHKTRFEEVARDLDVVFDTIGGDTQERSWKTLKNSGVLVSIIDPPRNERGRARGAFLRANHERPDQLEALAQMVAEGRLKVHVDTVLPLAEARKAHELSQSGHTRGKIVLEIVGD